MERTHVERWKEPGSALRNKQARLFKQHVPYRKAAAAAEYHPERRCERDGVRICTWWEASADICMQEAEQGSGGWMDAGAMLVKKMVCRGESAPMVGDADEAR